MDEKLLRVIFHHIKSPSLAQKSAREFANQVEAYGDDEEADETRTPRIHPSALAKCLRQAAFELNALPRSSVKIPEVVRRSAKIGRALHRLYQTAFHRAAKQGLFEFEYEVPLKSYEHPDVEKLMLDGSSDGVFTFEEKRLVLEIKGLGDDVFGSLSDPPDKHLYQAAVYQECLKAEGVWFIYANRKSFAETHRIRRIPESYWREMRNRAEIVLEHEVRNMFPPGINNSYECTMCSYKPICPDDTSTQVDKEIVWEAAREISKT